MRFVTEARVCPLTSRRRFAKGKSKAEALLQSVFNFSYQINTKCCIESATCCGMKSRFSEHGTNAEHCMESRTKGDGEIQAIA